MKAKSSARCLRKYHSKPMPHTHICKYLWEYISTENTKLIFRANFLLKKNNLYKLFSLHCIYVCIITDISSRPHLLPIRNSIKAVPMSRIRWWSSQVRAVPERRNQRSSSFNTSPPSIDPRATSLQNRFLRLHLCSRRSATRRQWRTITLHGSANTCRSSLMSKYFVCLEVI